MILKKIHFVIDKTAKADSSQKILLKRYRNYTPHQSNVIVVIGGDGFMLETLKKYRKYKKPFYGMNRGTFGFLMNKFKKKNLLIYISRSKRVSISDLEMSAITKKNTKKIAIAINEVSLLRQSKQAASLQVSNRKNSKIITKNLIKSWINIFFNYEPNTWEMEITAKRIIAWSSNTDITLENSEKAYKEKFFLSPVS